MSRPSRKHIKDKTFELLISERKIKAKVEIIAGQISEDYKDKKPLLIAVLNGSFIFAADLFREISVPAEISFIRMASYEGTSSSGDIKQILGLSDNIFQRDIIIVEDIIDSGLTIEKILEHFEERGAKSLAVCTLLLKPQNLKNDVQVNYKGFEINNEFVIGYGLDYDGEGRNLKDVFQLPAD
mgnify:CR=1 FL=1